MFSPFYCFFFKYIPCKHCSYFPQLHKQVSNVNLTDVHAVVFIFQPHLSENCLYPHMKKAFKLYRKLYCTPDNSNELFMSCQIVCLCLKKTNKKNICPGKDGRSQNFYFICQFLCPDKALLSLPCMCLHSFGKLSLRPWRFAKLRRFFKQLCKS